MMNFTDNLTLEIERNIRQIATREENKVRRVLSTIEMLESALVRLKEFIAGYTFADEQEEIRFFKEIKPGLFCRLLYYRKMYNIEMNRPMGAVEEQARYLHAELEQIQQYITRRLDFYRYFKGGATHSDREYFLRGNRSNNSQYLDSFYFERDPIFSTNEDFRVARILANDMLRRYIREELEKIRLNQYLLNQTPEIRLDTPRWTETKTGLIEILYSLAAMGCIDNGRTSLTRLAVHFEQALDVRLGNVSRAFNDMRYRRNPTDFLDRMKKALLEKIDDLEEKNMNENLTRNALKKSEKK